MLKLTLKTKQFFCSTQIQSWVNYLILGILCLNLVLSHITVAMAEADDKTSDGYNVLALEAIRLPELSVVGNDEENESILIQGNIFIQSLCQPGFDCPGDSFDDMLAVKKNKTVIVTAYSSTPDQTDSSPFITANGTFVRDGIVACNFLPFGAKVRFPELYGGKIFTVEDRMAKRNSHKIDIWMETRSEAIQFGVKRLAMEMLE